MFYSILTAQVRDDDAYLDEWIKYHLGLGFEHIVLQDHRSKNSVKDKFGSCHVSVYREDREAPLPELLANKTLSMYRDYTYWMANFDIDEFLVLHKHSNVNDLLENYEKFGGLAINWLVYGPSGHIQKPEGNVKDNYLWRTPDNWSGSGPNHQGANYHVKTIINVEHCIKIPNPHFCFSRSHVVNEDYEKVTGPFTQSSRTLCRLNHYFTRSLEEWMFKMNRGRGDGLPNRPMQEFYDTNDNSTIYDPILKGK